MFNVSNLPSFGQVGEFLRGASQYISLFWKEKKLQQNGSDAELKQA